MVLYTSAAMISSTAASTLLTESQMESEINNAYGIANDAFIDSDIDASLNIVHVQKVRSVRRCSCTGGRDRPSLAYLAVSGCPSFFLHGLPLCVLKNMFNS